MTKRVTKTDSTELGRFAFFGKLMEMIKNYGWKNIVFGVFVLLTIIAGPKACTEIVDKAMDRWASKEETRHRKGLELRQNADMLIPPLLDNLVYRSGADRAMILEFHNGGTNNSNLPFYHFSATYERTNIDRGITESVRSDYKNQDTGDYYLTMKMLNDHRYVWYEDINVALVETPAITKMKKNDVTSVYMTTIIDDNGDKIGVLTLTTKEVRGMNISETDELVLEIRQRLGHLLTGVPKEQK